MTPQSKHVLIAVIFIIVILAGLLFAEQAGGKRSVENIISGQAAVLVESLPSETRLERVDEGSAESDRDEFLMRLKGSD